MGILNPVIEKFINREDLHVVRYCAMEVDRQGDGPLFVGYMYEAWKYCCLMNPLLGGTTTEKQIMIIGALVKGLGTTGYRQTHVSFANEGTAVYYDLIPRLMEQLIEYQEQLTHDEFVKEFLRIHPFEDGNGRVASLLHNLRCGTLENPHPLPHYEF